MGSQLLCRCCLRQPPIKDLFAAYPRLGETVIYAEIMKNCFSIQLNSSSDHSANGICKRCLVRLHDASDFKAQVQKCQIDMEMKLSIKINEVKSEKPKVKTENNDNVDDLYDDNDMKCEDEIKTEPENECVNEDGHDQKLSEVLGSKLKDITIKRIQRKRKDDNTTQDVPNKKTFTITISKKISREDVQLNTDTDKLSNKHKSRLSLDNMNNIIHNSNATVFYTQDMAGILCLYCRKTIPNLQQLRNHIKNYHNTDDKLRKALPYYNGILKLDVTDLKCNICNENIDTIDRLKQHLTEKHKIKFNSDVDSCIFEFKLKDNQTYDCALCNATYERFKTLLQHMNTHYRNYVCDVCDRGFINRPKFQKHKRTHEQGSYQCSLCEKIFPTKTRLSDHEKYSHSGSSRITTNCPHCEKTFTSYYWRNIHLKEDHNVTTAGYKCNSCDKTFMLKGPLTAHIKKVHLMERNQICPHCSKGYYNKEALRSHLITHEGVRIYKCDICQKSYARKKTLREHMRIHEDDRRFKCGVCGLRFVQKCSMKSHMVSNHGVTLTEYEQENKG